MPRIYLYDRRTAPPALLSRCLSAFIAIVTPDVTLSERAVLRQRGIAVFEQALPVGRRGEA